MLKQKLANGASLEDIKFDAFATLREASKRCLGMRHYDVQLIGGMVLHEGRIAEMKTGEGKTLVATLPCYLNALEGKGVHVVTVNDYLAKRDAEWMGRLYNWMDLSVGVVVPQQRDGVKKRAYRCDITYGQNNEFGFDYLRDNMKLTHRTAWSSAASVELRGRRRGRLDPDRRGAHPADHQRAPGERIERIKYVARSTEMIPKLPQATRSITPSTRRRTPPCSPTTASSLHKRC